MCRHRKRLNYTIGVQPYVGKFKPALLVLWPFKPQRWLAISRRSLEVEVDKRLYGAAFYLYNDINNDNQE